MIKGEIGTVSDGWQDRVIKEVSVTLYRVHACQKNHGSLTQLAPMRSGVLMNNICIAVKRIFNMFMAKII